MSVLNLMSVGEVALFFIKSYSIDIVKFDLKADCLRRSMNFNEHYKNAPNENEFRQNILVSSILVKINNH